MIYQTSHISQMKNNKTNATIRTDVTEMLRRFRESGSNRLNLAGCGLYEIPEEVFSLTDMEVINLSGNCLRTIPKQLLDLPTLRKMILIGNPIEFLSDRPGLTIDGRTYLRCRKQVDAKNLTLVIAADTPLGEAKSLVAELKTARVLQGLSLGKWMIDMGTDYPKPSRAIRKILDSLESLDYLEALSLRGMALGVVPESIRRLRWLKRLDLSALGLTFLPG